MQTFSFSILIDLKQGKQDYNILDHHANHIMFYILGCRIKNDKIISFTNCCSCHMIIFLTVKIVTQKLNSGYCNPVHVGFWSRATRLYTPLCQLVGWSVSRSVGWSPFYFFGVFEHTAPAQML